MSDKYENSVAFSNEFCNKYNQYLTDCNNDEIARGCRPKSALDATCMLDAYILTE